MATHSSEEKHTFSETFQGQLFKYTNVVKGWCPRWFILEPRTGFLDYYLSENETNQKPRGTLELLGAVVSPSDEDSHTFTVSSSTGDFFKLRANDARERQEWVNRIRAVSEEKGKLPQSSGRSTVQNRRLLSLSPWENYSSSVGTPVSNPPKSVKDWAAAHGEADQQIKLIADLFDQVKKDVDALPSSGPVTNANRQLMQLNSTTLMTLHTLQDAIRILENEAYKNTNIK